MKIFSRALLAFILAATAAPLAKAAVTTISGNIYDVGKYSFSSAEELWFGTYYLGPNQDGTPNDSAMCWAAAASNVIQHWQDTYMDKADAPQMTVNGTSDSGYASPTGTAGLDVYRYLLDTWTPGSGISYNVFSWWMQGRTVDGKSPGFIYSSSGTSRLKNDTSDEYGGFYTGIFGSHDTSATHRMPSYPSLDNAPFFSAQLKESGQAELTPTYGSVTDAIKSAFTNEGQAIALNLLRPDNSGGHAISCWGYETDSNGNITALILSDSDDRMYGTFMVSLTESTTTVNGEERIVATISTSRYNSWYHSDTAQADHGKYIISDVMYIATPDKDLSGNDVAIRKHDQTSITDLIQPVTVSCNLTQAVDSSKAVQIGGASYSDSNLAAAILFTSDKNISIHDSSSGLTAAQLTIKDGAMVLLSGDLVINGENAQMTGGVEADGHLYVHGSQNLRVSNCQASHSGAGIYGTNASGTGLYAGAYIEAKNTGTVDISSNAVLSSSTAAIGGGAIASEDSFDFETCGTISFSNNTIEGYTIRGGAAYAANEATFANNSSISFSENSLTSDGSLGEGGALSAWSSIIKDTNNALVFSKNEVTVNNEGAKHYQDPSSQHIYQGSNAHGGAIAVSYSNALTDKNAKYLAGSLLIENNNLITFSENSVSAAVEHYWATEAHAAGGAIYIGQLQNALNKVLTGSNASLSGNNGLVTFKSNSASAVSAYEGTNNGTAQGGAIFVSEGSIMDMSNNKAGIVWDSNSVKASVKAQGGAIYNAGDISISHNGDVVFKNNRAINGEGDHIYNAAEAVANIAWNKSIDFESTEGQTGSVRNEGTMYFVTEQSGSIDFHNTKLETVNSGTTYLGKDFAGVQGTGSLSFHDSASDTDMTITAANGVAELSKLTISAQEITGTGKDTTTLTGVDIETSAALQISMLTLKSDVGIAGNDTMSQVVIDFTGEDYTIVETDHGKCYVYNLDNMASGALTLNNVTFKSTLTQLSDYNSEKDWIAFYFGGDTTISENPAVTLNMAGVNATYRTAKGGAVYFGENVNPPDIDVPEPATGILALVGLAGLAGRRRRK